MLIKEKTSAKKKPLKKVVAAMALSAALILVPTVAFAEGSFTSYMSQAQPSFSSRTWSDQNLDSVKTTVTFSGCKANYGGKAPGTLAISSIDVSLYRGSTYLGYKRVAGCGSFVWSDMPKGSYHFYLEAVNGITPLSGTRVFLNVAKVTVSY